MKRLIIPFVALFVVAVALISWRTKAAKLEGVVRIDIGCQVIDGDGFIQNVGPGESVITSSGNGHVKCRADVNNSTGKAVKWDFDNTGILCNVAGAGTTDSWQNIVSASGQATLQCHVNPGN